MKANTTLKKLIDLYKKNGSPGVLVLENISEQPTELPNEIFELSDLRELTIKNIPLRHISKKILNLRRLTKLLLINVAIEEFPLELIHLGSLSEFGLQSDKIQQLPAEWNDWITLDILHVNNCANLRSLNGLPPNLTSLDISSTAIRQVPENIFKLEMLETFVACELFLKKIPDELFEMGHLRGLYLANNDLGSIPKEIEKLHLLQELSLSENKLTELPVYISSLKHLTYLDLSDNLIERIPDSLVDLKKLEIIYLQDNNLDHFPLPLLELKNVTSISLSNYGRLYPASNGNLIRSIPDGLLRLKKLTYLNMHGCGVSNVPLEIISQGVDAIKNFLRSKIEADSEAFLFEAKMVVVGRGNVGKTALTKKLTDPGYSLEQLKSTEGIDILKNPFLFPLEDKQEFKFNIWDFGGQEKYDATHQLFITNRSIYLFLTEAREESNYLDFYYWLNTINLFSDNSPVIVVLSKFDERKKHYPQSDFKEKFKNIVAFVDVSCADGYEHTVQSLKQAISDAIKLLPQKNQKLSNRWVEIRNDLEQLAATRDYITYEEYLVVCQNNKLDKVQAGFLSQFLNDLGVIIHHKNDLLLRKTVFINTDWCVDGIYKILDDDNIFAKNGKFSVEDLETLWNEARFESKQPELLKLMIEYNLCFELKDGSGYIAPDLLPPDKPEGLTWEASENLQFEIRYEFMPAGILSRFIVKSHSFIKDKLFWRYGVVLEYDQTKALVEEDYLNRKVKILLKGENKKGLLAAARMFLEEVHRDLDKENKLIFDEMIPCNCQECRSKQPPHFFKFRILKKFEQQGRMEVPCENSGEDVRIKALIDDVQLNTFSHQFFSDNEDLRSFILYIIDNELEKDITMKAGYNNFWRDLQCTKPKNEVEFQPYISSLIDNYCKVRGINLSREVREANGSVDILFTYTRRDNVILKVCLEVKKADHNDIETAIDTQLPAYMQSVGTNSGIYLVIWLKNSDFQQPKKYDDGSQLLLNIQKRGSEPAGISVRLINCNKGLAPSRIRPKKKRQLFT